jgi:hypothetical protein
VTVSCYDPIVLGQSGVGHEFAVLSVYVWKGQLMVQLYNPWGIAADGTQVNGNGNGQPYVGTQIDGATYDAEGLFSLPYGVFAERFGTFVTCGNNNV